MNGACVKTSFLAPTTAVGWSDNMLWISWTPRRRHYLVDSAARKHRRLPTPAAVGRNFFFLFCPSLICSAPNGGSREIYELHTLPTLHAPSLRRGGLECLQPLTRSLSPHLVSLQPKSLIRTGSSRAPSHDFHVRVQSLQDTTSALGRLSLIFLSRMAFLFFPTQKRAKVRRSAQCWSSALLLFSKSFFGVCILELREITTRADLITAVEVRPFRVDKKKGAARARARPVGRREFGVNGDTRPSEIKIGQWAGSATGSVEVKWKK